MRVPRWFMVAEMAVVVVVRVSLSQWRSRAALVSLALPRVCDRQGREPPSNWDLARRAHRAAPATAGVRWSAILNP